MRILFATLGVPYPPDRGNRQRDYHLLRRVARCHDVSVVIQQASGDGAEHERRHLESFCERVELVDATPTRALSRRAAEHLWARRPLATLPYWSDEMARRVRATAAALAPDVVQIEHSFLAPYIDALPPGSRAKTVLCLHNVGSLQYGSMLRMRLRPRARALHALKWLAMLRWEARAARRFDHVVVVSQSERGLLRRADSRLAISVVENAVDTAALAPLPEPPRADTLLFIGTFTYPPNVDAALHLGREILPLVQRSLPAARLLLVGHEPTAAVRALANLPGITVDGAARDARPAYRRASVAVAPLRAGGGTRLKILEAMALGRPVVSTRLGAKGLAVGDGEHLLLADAPGEIAAALVRLLRDSGLRARLSTSARRLVERRYDWDHSAAALLRVYAELAAGAPAAAVEGAMQLA